MGVIDGTKVFETLTFTHSKKSKTSLKMAKKAGGKKKKSSSNVFSQFEQSQIQEFKEAFQMIDADRNGIITVGDLKATYASLGVRDIDQDMLDNMCAEAGAPINFTIFLNMLADKLHGTDPEDVIVKAFKLFDKDNKGVVPASQLADVLKSQADRFNEEEWKQFMDLAKPNEEGLVDYKALCYTLTHGGGDEDEEDEE